MRLMSHSLAIALLLTGATAASAQSTEPTVRVRGTIESADAASVVVKSREGPSVTIKLRENWGVTGIKKASLDDIKPGTFVGAAATGRGDALQALEVLVFPAGAKSNEGHYPWDLLPESTMTNATVASTISGVDGPVLSLAYPGGEKKIAITPATPIVTFAPAEKSDVKPGMAVMIPAQQAADGSFSAARIIVGNNGIAPPM